MKSVVLLSGGLDSTTLLHYVLKELGEEVFPLFVSYGQPQISQELRLSKKQCMKLREEGYPVDGLEVLNMDDLFYREDEKEEISQRNLIFISHAARYAEQVGANSIYIAVIDPQKETGRYIDTSPEFISAMSEVLMLSGIELKTPFINYTKYDVFVKSRYYGLKEEDTWSCFSPISCQSVAMPCGVCANCKFRKEVYDNLNVIWTSNDWTMSDKFKYVFATKEIEEARFLTNNECNLNCGHCFYGFKEMIGERMPLSKWLSLVDECKEIGVKNIHFSGKEPFINKDIFTIVDYIKENTDMTYDVVTNGTMIEKYLAEIKSAGFSRVCVSFDNWGSGTLRQENSIKPVKILLDNNVPVHIFICIHKGNVRDTISNIKQWISFGVKDFFITHIHPSGNAVNIKDNYLSCEEISEFYSELSNEIWNDDVYISFSIKGSYIEQLFEDELLFNDAMYVALTGFTKISPNINLIIDIFCWRYFNQITITPDGFLLGCGTEVGSSRYDLISAGNVNKNSLTDVIKTGKNMCISQQEKRLKCVEINGCSRCGGDCSHTSFCYLGRKI